MNEKRRAALANLIVGCQIGAMRAQFLVRNPVKRRGYRTLFRRLTKQIRQQLKHDREQKPGEHEAAKLRSNKNRAGEWVGAV